MKQCFYCEAELDEDGVYVDLVDKQECCLDCLEEGRDVAAIDAGEYDLLDTDFADPSGRSSLRAETPDNPRIYPCPTCGEKGVLTLKDVRLGYQCNRCADRAEGYGP